MAAQIYFLVEWHITPGSEDAFQSLAAKAIERVRSNEPGAKEYAWHFSPDRKTCYIVEAYVDSAAVLLHLTDVADIVDQLSLVASTARFEVFGNVSAEAHAALAAIGANITPLWSRP